MLYFCVIMKNVFYFLLFNLLSFKLAAQIPLQDSIVWLIDSTNSASYEFQYTSSQRALTLAQNAQQVEFQAKALIKMATTQSFLGNHVAALENFSRAKLLIDKNELFNLKKTFYLKKAGVLVRIKDYEEAIAHNEEAVEWFLAEKDSINLGLTYGNIGAVHYLQRKFETSLAYYEKALAILKNAPKKKKNMIFANLAGLYITQEQPRKAIPILEIYLEQTREKKSTIHEVSILMNLGLAYSMINNYKKSFDYYNTALHIAENEDLIDARYETYRLMSFSYELKGDYLKALDTYRKYKEIQEEVVGKKTQKEIAELNLKYEVVQNEKELAINKEKVIQLEQEAKIKNQRYLLFFATLLTLTGFGTLLYFKRKADYEKNKKLYLAEQELMQINLKNKELSQQRLQEKLAYKNQDLTNLTLDITRKNEFSKQLLFKIDHLEQYVPKGARNHLQSIRLFVSNNLRINEELAVFQKNIEEVNQDFYHQLLQRFPNLTSKETDLCGLIKLGRTNKEIASLKGISLNSAKMNRYRLRKKLGIDSKEDIVNFLREIG